MLNLIWHSQKRKISELTPAEYNPRQLTKKQALELDASLAKFSLADPIVINKDNRIIGGHQRVSILKDKNIEEVDVRVPDRQLTLEEEKELNLRLNKNLGEWDIELLADFDEDLLKDIGFLPEELDDIFNSAGEPDEKDDIVPEVRETDIKLGDMFQLGEHRLLCGDATKKEDVEKLMQGEKADMVFTDPPYGMDAVKNSGVLKERYRDVIGDDTNKTAVESFLLLKSLNIKKMVFWGANYYTECLPSTGCWLVWDKNNGGSDQTDAELAWTNFNGVVRKYTQASEKKNRVHPTQKPVELISWVLDKWGDRHNTIIDVFGGSGSTLIACEKTNRKCRMMELDPVYCQVIIDRWEEYTNQKAEKLNGQTQEIH